jgi:hypothetical protein
MTILNYIQRDISIVWPGKENTMKTKYGAWPNGFVMLEIAARGDDVLKSFAKILVEEHK